MNMLTLERLPMTMHEKIRDIINDSMFYITENLDNEESRWDDSTRAISFNIWGFGSSKSQRNSL